ncbi:MAG: tetratricopeptide repeat protein [Acidobacteria bacterium]|nr:tetratricopeptide repeat protein [Acidobacteriota bacterium]
MRIFVIPGYCLWLAAGSVFLEAEAIHLKNGDILYADQVREAGQNFEYEVGDNSFTIPKSKVQSIEATTPPPERNLPVASEVPAFTPQASLADEPELLTKIAGNGQVDRSALARIESLGNPARTAVAFYIAGRSEYEGGKFEQARRDFETALHADPENPAVLNYYAALLVRTGNARQAVTYAERAVRIAPTSPDALAVLGYAQFAADHPREAVESWKRSLALRPDDSLRTMLARAERESEAEGNYSERESGHFVLRYEGKQSSESFRAQLLATLEADYQELAREFASEPRATIAVVLYTNQTFFDVTRAPSWTGALNDGKLRIPLEGLETVTPELARVLKHELAHSFINQLTTGRCPQWLNEGLAQMLEPQSLGPRAPRLAELFAAGREAPLNTLEGQFSSFTGLEANLAYDESLATVEYLRNHYGMSDLLGLLERLGQGDSVESALRSTIHSDYRQLEDEVRGYLTGAMSK